MDIERIRRQTPGCKDRLHFNNAGAALMPQTAVDTIKDYIDLEAGIGGYEAAAKSAERITAAYASVARLINARPRNIAFTENATASFVAALSSVHFRVGDVVLTTQHDYSSNQIQFLSLKKRFGIEVVRAPDSATGGVDVAAMRDLIKRLRPALVCVTEVPTNSGLVQDVAAIGAACEDQDTIYLVDACQSVGQMPVDVANIRCDFLSATSRKFLRGPRGCGFLYVSDRMLEKGAEPLFPDMHGADWIAPGEYRISPTASRFENFEFAWALVLATGAAASYALDIGLEPIRQRVRSLTSGLREQLSGLAGVRVLEKSERPAGILTLAFDHLDPFEVVDALRAQGINTSAQAREYAVIDYDQLGVQAALRLSPHYYNTEEEVSQLVEAIAALVLKGS